jgi:hypothetical protein
MLLRTLEGIQSCAINSRLVLDVNLGVMHQECDTAGSCCSCGTPEDKLDPATDGGQVSHVRCGDVDMIATYE